MSYMKQLAIFLAYFSGVLATLTTIAFSYKEIGVGIIGGFGVVASYCVALELVKDKGE